MRMRALIASSSIASMRYMAKTPPADGVKCSEVFLRILMIEKLVTMSQFCPIVSMSERAVIIHVGISSCVTRVAVSLTVHFALIDNRHIRQT